MGNFEPNNIQYPLANYIYHSNTIGDAVGDIRVYNNSGIHLVEKCEVLNAVKGAGTWFTVYSSNMPANTVKVNATASTANAQDLPLTTDTVLGRESGNIVPIPITNILSGKDTLITGQCTIIDANITINSWAAVCVSTVGVSTSVPIKFTASAGSMLFTTGQITDTCEFGYIIFI